MKKIALTLSFLTFLLSCKEETGITIKDSLRIKIENIIDSHTKYVNQHKNNLYDPPIYEVTFKKYDETCYLFINTNNIYNTKMDGYIFVNSKLVTFNNISSDCNNNFIKIDTKENTTNIEDFINEKGEYDIYDPFVWEFKIDDGNFISNDGS